MASQAEATDFLCFRLWGPMASWGSVAVGELRGTWSRPSRSAIIGFVAAACGIERKNRAAHDELERGLGFAVRVDLPGRTLRDYHTAQAPGAKRNKRWMTRRDELAEPNELNTILSERSYLTEQAATILLWRRVGTNSPTLDTVKCCLIAPIFTPYLGRKSCPLGLPLTPIGPLRAADPVAALTAFDAYPASTLHGISPKYETYARERQGKRPELWMDAGDASAFRLPSDERTVRRDRVRDRSRWLFADRDEVLIRAGSPQQGATP